jgi:hypothetical protein
VRTSQAFVQCLKEATLENSGLEEEDIERLRNPTAILPDHLDDRYLRLSIDVFLACTNASEETYKSVRAAILRCDHCQFLSQGLLPSAQKKLNWT